MNQRLFCFLFAIFVFTGLSAQQIIPLDGYDFLNSTNKGITTPSFAKMDCENLLPEGIVQITSGDSSIIDLTLDTTGYPAGSAYFCLNCDNLNAGTLVADAEEITYFSNNGIDQALDTLDLAFCTANADSCGSIETVIVLVQRAPQTFNFPPEILQPQERIEISVPADNLPGGLACRDFIDCEDDYLGTEQLSLFLNGLNQNNNFRYQSARYAGTDQVCLVLCNSLGLCDQYNYFFEIIRPNVDIPFFDDFSIEGNRPNLSLWQNEDVLINRNYGINPPSIGVATFDAVGPRGNPNNNGSDDSGPRDFLTSAGINLAAANDATLSFYYQARGLGNRPERADSLVLEFLHPDGTWRWIWSTEGRSSGEGNCSDIPFEPVLLSIPEVYEYNGFQFRFFNYSDQSGALDHWHLDYVKLIDGEAGTTVGLNDVALATVPPNVTTPYSSIPYRQLVAGGSSLLRDVLPLNVWNHNPTNPVIDLTTSEFTIFTDDGSELIIPIPFDALGSVPNNGPFMVDELISSTPFNNFANEILDFTNTGNEQYSILSTYTLNPGTEASNPNIEPFVIANNTATTTTLLGDTYAYDDGTAELALQNLPNQIVVQRYEAFTEEVLRGVSIRLPRASTSNNSNLSIELQVYIGELENGNDPDYSMEVTPVYVENFYSDSLDGFTSYAFPDSVDIPIGPFYVGWKQLGTCTECLPVGLDRNTIIPNTRFFRNNNNWFPFDGCSTGAVMVRPLVGDSPVPVTSVSETNEVANLVTVFPNPASEVVQLRPVNGLTVANLEWTLVNLSGQTLSHGRGNQIAVAQFPAGVYLLRVMDSQSGRFSQHKLVIE